MGSLVVRRRREQVPIVLHRMQSAPGGSGQRHAAATQQEERHTVGICRPYQASSNTYVSCQVDRSQLLAGRLRSVSGARRGFVDTAREVQYYSQHYNSVTHDNVNNHVLQ